MIFLIPLVGVLMRFVQTRVIIAVGFFIMGCALLYSSRLSPQIDFKTLVLMRAFRRSGWPFCSCRSAPSPITTLAARTERRRAALFSMFRNVFGSIGISLGTALVVQRSQVHQSYLSQYATPFYQPYNALVASYERTLIAMGHAAQYAHDAAVGKVYQMFQAQVAILAYSDVFLFFGIAAFCVVPLCFLASGGRAKAAPGAAH